MKKHQTAKHKKRHKKERANRKAKQEQTLQTKPVLDDGELGEFAPGAMERILEATKPISPARRAFQDV